MATRQSPCFGIAVSAYGSAVAISGTKFSRQAATLTIMKGFVQIRAVEKGANDVWTWRDDAVRMLVSNRTPSNTF